METKQKITYGVMGVLTLLVLGFGGSLYLTQDQIDKAYVCSANEKLGIFDKISSTGVTGYYTNESGSAKTTTCSGGKWISLKTYAASKGVDISTFLDKGEPTQITPPEPSSSPQIKYTGGIQYKCDLSSCTTIQ